MNFGPFLTCAKEIEPVNEDSTGAESSFSLAPPIANYCSVLLCRVGSFHPDADGAVRHLLLAGSLAISNRIGCENLGKKRNGSSKRFEAAHKTGGKCTSGGVCGAARSRL